MKKLLLLVAVMLCCVSAIFAQNNKISYQAVVRDTENRLVANQQVTVTVSIFNGAETTAAYSETQTTTTNLNGLISMLVGDGTVTGGSWEAINWKTAHIETTVTLNGTSLGTLAMPITAVPYAKYADYADSVNLNLIKSYAQSAIAYYFENIHQEGDAITISIQSDWEQTDEHAINYIMNKPDLDQYAKKDTLNYYYTKAQSDAKYLTSFVETDPNVPDWAKAATKPVYNYSEIQNTPTIPTVPTNVSAFTNDAGYIKSYTETDPTVPAWAKANSKPTYDYSEITNKPNIKDTIGGYLDTCTVVANMKTDITNLQNGIRKEALCDSVADCVSSSISTALSNYYTIAQIENKLADTIRYATKKALKDTAAVLRGLIPTGSTSSATLNTNNTNALEANSSETLSGEVNLHKVSKTGSYTDLNNKPSIKDTVSTYLNEHNYITNTGCTEVNICDLVAQMNNLANTVNGLNSTIENLNNTVSAMQHTIDSLEAVIDNHSGDIPPTPPTGSRLIRLDTIHRDFVAQDRDTLTGALGGNYKISIADGATVTLMDANISSLTIGATYAGITCNGDATILLEDSNTVIGGLYNDNGTYRGCYPGIFIAEGHTLTINGTGSLLAKYGSIEELAQYASGIGGSKDSSCGNIVIVGGTIYAYGGESAAGIGGGTEADCGGINIFGGTIYAYGGSGAPGIGSGVSGGSNGEIVAHCGDITISGGIVYAYGGYTAPAIGSSANGTCGNITIDNTVTRVTATKGETITSIEFEGTTIPLDLNKNCIGKGDFGTCGTVTIGGTMYYDGTNYVNGGETYITRSPLIYLTGHALASAVVGDIICSDGLAYAGTDYNILPSGVTAKAKVCYVSGDGHGLALALADEGQMNWSTAKSTCEGKTPTITGCTWKLATKEEWDNMISAAGGYTDLRDGFTSVGGVNMWNDYYYWSSSEISLINYAWTCACDSGIWDSNYKGSEYGRARACLAF